MEFRRQGLPLATLSLLPSLSLSLKGLSSGYGGSEAHRTNRCCSVAITDPRDQEKNCGFGQVKEEGKDDSCANYEGIWALVKLKEIVIEAPLVPYRWP